MKTCERLMQEQCEWNPDTDAPALDGTRWHGAAVLRVGAGKDNWHLCESCAALPRFKRLRTRVPLKRREGSDVRRE